MRLPRIAVLCATLFAVGCGTSDPNAFHAGCDRIDALQVGAGLTPTIGWSPDCAVHRLAVFQALTAEDPGSDPLTVGATMWEVSSSQIAGNTIDPVVRYGQVPSGTTQRAPLVPLTAGQPYVVFVSTLALDGPSTGSRRFFIP